MPNAHNESLASLPSFCICLYCGSDSYWLCLMAVLRHLFISVPRPIHLLMKAHFKLAIFLSRDEDTEKNNSTIARLVGHHAPQMVSRQLLQRQTSIAGPEGSNHCLCLLGGGVSQPNCLKMTL